MSPADLPIEPINVATAPDADRRAFVDLLQTMDRERVPEDPPAPGEAILARVSRTPPTVDIRRWIARAPDDSFAGLVVLVRHLTPGNERVREIYVNVHPSYRRRGVGLRLLDVGVRAADGETVITNTNDRVPAGAAFTRRFVLDPVSTGHVNQLELARVDRAMLSAWIAAAPPDYEILWITDELPDELMPQLVVAFDTMNTAPRDGIGIADMPTTPEFVRGFWQQLRAQGRSSRLLLALHRATREAAGFTHASYDPRVPTLVQQHGTAVVPAHRGHGLGKWLKAAMLERVLTDWPEARYVRTGNADSNAPMLAINHALGFRPAWAVTVWQGPLSRVRADLAR